MSAHASALTSAELSAGQEDLLELSENRVWRTLLGFQADDTRSEILSSDFFLAESGQISPYDELIATLGALAESVSENPNEHAQCRFPARYLWLSRQLELAMVEPIHCPDYLTFSAEDGIDSVSIVYATGFLGNPASYYGHLLVKFNQSANDAKASLENTSINYGAIIPDNENMLVYIAKGLFGGYSSGYTHREYFYHTHNYGENELRDLWEYELALRPEDRKLFIAHSWELMGREYRYYFLNRNCGYQIGQLLSLVTEQELVNKSRPWVLPQNVMQSLASIEYHDAGMVEDIHYMPSRQSRLYRRYQQLNQQEQTFIKRLVNDPAALDGEAFHGAPLASQQRLLDTLMDYYQFMLVDGIKDEKSRYKARHRRALLLRYQLPPGGPEIEFTPSSLPHSGRKPSYFSLGIRTGSDNQRDVHFRLRPAYYDSLDSSGDSTNSTLSMGELTFSVSKDRVKLDRLTLVDIENLNRNMTHLPGDRAHSWRLSSGIQEKYLGCDRCLALKVDAATGYASSMWDGKLVVGAFIGAGYFAERDTREGWFASPSVSVNVAAGPRVNARVNWGVREYYGGESQAYSNFQARFATGAQTDLRFHYQKQDNKQELGLAWGVYW